MRLFIILIAGTLLLPFPGIRFGQESRAVILGRVTDASGAGIVGAKVQVTSLATGAELSSVTGGDGDYQIPYVIRIDVNQGGFNQTTNVIPTLDNGQSFIATLANPFPNGFQLPPGSSQGLSTFLGRAISFFNERQLNPYIQRWSLSVQQELPGRIVAEVSYVGSRGTKLGVQRNLNPIPRQYLSTKNECDQPVIDFLSAVVRNPFFGLPEFAGTPLASQNVARSQLLRPYPHFGDINDTDPRPEEVISDQDFPHRFVLNGIYELPFGKGRKWLNDNKWVDYAIGGWQLQGWFEGQSGEALGFGNAIVRAILPPIRNSKRRSPGCGKD